MPIEVSCNSCNKRLRVPDTAAGKRVKCPQCQNVISVPAGGGGGDEKYHVKTEDGQTYGPVTKAELDEWLAEERITADTQLLKDGSDQWQWATDIYPQLEQQAAPAPSGGGGPDFGGIDSGGGADDNPFGFIDQGGPGGAPAGGAMVSTGPAAGPSYGGGPTGESDKSKLVAGLLTLFVGNLGVGRFYLGYTGLGVLQLLTCGGCGWWSLIEAIMIFTGSIDRDAQGRKLKD